jgi:hypothetical protein
MTILNILWPFDIIYSLLVQFVVIWYIFLFWYVWTKKNLATLDVGSASFMYTGAQDMHITTTVSYNASAVKTYNKTRLKG